MIFYIIFRPMKHWRGNKQNLILYYCLYQKWEHISSNFLFFFCFRFCFALSFLSTNGENVLYVSCISSYSMFLFFIFFQPFIFEWRLINSQSNLFDHTILLTCTLKWFLQAFGAIIYWFLVTFEEYTVSPNELHLNNC